MCVYRRLAWSLWLLAACGLGTVRGQALPKPGMPLIVQNPYATAETLAGLHIFRNTYQEGYKAPTGLVGIRVAYLNALSNRGPAFGYTAGESPLYGNTIHLRAAIVANGSIIPLTFQGNLTTLLPNQGATLSDCANVALAKGAVYYIRTEVWVTSLTLSWPLNDLYASLPNVGSSNTQLDVLLDPSATFDKTSGPTGFGPTAIYGQPASNGSTELMWDHGLVMLGDSILLGPSPISGFTTGSYPYRAAVSAHVPFLNFGRGGEAMMDFADPAGGLGRRKLLQSAPTLFFEYGVNDLLLHHRTLAQMQADFQSVVSAFRLAGGKRVVAVSLTPIVFGSNGSAEDVAARSQWRSYLRNLTPDDIGLDYIFVDVGPVDEESPGSNIWWHPSTSVTSPYTTDGLHPNETGKQNIVNVIGPQLVGAFIEPFADLSSIELSSLAMKGGVSATGSLKFNLPVQRGGSISLQCDRPDLVQLPPTVKVASGQAAVVFQIGTAPVSTATVVHLRAQFRGVTVWSSVTLTR